MHIPDGFLSTPVALILWIVSAIIIAISLRRVSADMGERQIPMMGVLAACIFAGQMLNFTVAGGTSGHLLGAALAAILLGPWAAVLVMTCVLGVQALIFQDGGLLALGANIFNMGIIGAFVGHFAYTTLRRLAGGKSWGIFAGGFIGAWLAVVISALACALQLAISGTSPANIAVPAMGGIHVLIGIGEGLITVGALAFIYATRRDLLGIGESKPAGKVVWVAGLVIALALAILSPLASAYPDGLESVAEQAGFLQQASNAPFSVIPDYAMPGVSNEALATIIAGVIGVVIVAAVAGVLALSRRNAQRKTS
jgi:cobalt/nickel transport system permease protein